MHSDTHTTVKQTTCTRDLCLSSCTFSMSKGLLTIFATINDNSVQMVMMRKWVGVSWKTSLLQSRWPFSFWGPLQSWSGQTQQEMLYSTSSWMQTGDSELWGFHAAVDCFSFALWLSNANAYVKLNLFFYLIYPFENWLWINNKTFTVCFQPFSHTSTL